MEWPSTVIIHCGRLPPFIVTKTSTFSKGRRHSVMIPDTHTCQSSRTSPNKNLSSSSLLSLLNSLPLSCLQSGSPKKKKTPTKWKRKRRAKKNGSFSNAHNSIGAQRRLAARRRWKKCDKFMSYRWRGDSLSHMRRCSWIKVNCESKRPKWKNDAAPNISLTSWSSRKSPSMKKTPSNESR